MNNIFKTGFLLSALTLLFVFMGQALGGRVGMGYALVIACVMNLGAYWFSDKIVLRMSRATEITGDELPEIHAMVRRLAERANLPTPKIYYLPSAMPNAFATGRDPQHGVVALSKGLMEQLNSEEISGVIAHELGHIRHRDTLTSSVAAILAGAIGMLASLIRWGAFLGGSRRGKSGQGNNPISLLVMSLIMPFAAIIIQMAISRSREFTADLAGAEICGNPLYLASALCKIDKAARHSASIPTVSPTMAHLYISNPLKGGGYLNLFRTHPPISERIDRLEEMAK